MAPTGSPDWMRSWKRHLRQLEQPRISAPGRWSTRRACSSGPLRPPDRVVGGQHRVYLLPASKRFARSISDVRDCPAVLAPAAAPDGVRRRNHVATPPSRRQRCDDPSYRVPTELRNVRPGCSAMSPEGRRTKRATKATAAAPARTFRESLVTRGRSARRRIEAGRAGSLSPIPRTWAASALNVVSRRSG